MDKEKAKKIVEKYLLFKIGYYENICDNVVIMDDLTIEKPYGWIFIYQSAQYLKTRNPLDAFGGNGPIFVNKKTGEVIELGTAISLDDTIKKLDNDEYLKSV